MRLIKKTAWCLLVAALAIATPSCGKDDPATEPTPTPGGNTVDVRLERVSAEVYEFWRMFSNTALFGASELFDSSFSLPSNVSGGYGIWSVAGTSAVAVEL